MIAFAALPPIPLGWYSGARILVRHLHPSVRYVSITKYSPNRTDKDSFNGTSQSKDYIQPIRGVKAFVTARLRSAQSPPQEITSKWDHGGPHRAVGKFCLICEE